MTKIVYNGCYGGFGLTDEGLAYYNALSGGNHERSYDIPRDDPNLVKTVEDLGSKAGECLEITELPKGTPYRIDEYDGLESVMTVGDYEWSRA